MRIMIIGAGQVGFYLCERLSTEGHDVVLIDTNKEKLQRIERDLNIMAVHGSGASARVLAEAGIAKTDLFIAVTDIDEVNLITCIMSKQYNVATRIARVRNQDFMEDGILEIKDLLGVDMVISPDLAMAEELVALCTVSAAFDMAEFAHGRLMLLGYVMHEKNPRVGHTLHELRTLYIFHQFIVAAIIRDGKTIIPRGDDRIRANDKLYIMVRRRHISSVEKLLGIASKIPEKVFIIGGGSIGYLVARSLEELDIDVSLIEINEQRCEFLSENLHKTMVLNFDGLEANDLLGENIDRADLVISITESDTTNILSSLLAKHHGAKKCITRITRQDFIPMLDKLGIDVPLSPRQVAARLILRHVRRGAVESVATILDSDAEAMEIKVPAQKRFNNVALKELHFPAGSIVGAIVRNGQVIIPSGETLLQPEDNLVIFFTKDAVSKVEKYLGAEV